MVIEINLNPPVPALPRIEDKTKINLRYVLISPYVSVHVYWDQRQGELIYEIEEPILNETEKSLLKTLELSLGEMINVNVLVEKTKESMIDYIDKTSRLLIEELDLRVGEESYKKIFYYLFRDFVGLNEIEPLMRDFFIEDVECNGINTPIYIVHRLYRNMKTNIRFDSMDELSSFVEKLAQRCGKYVSYANPLLDGSLPDGSLDYEEPVIYKENGIVKINKIGNIIDKFYEDKEKDEPVKIENLEVPAFDSDYKIKWKKAQYVYRHKINEDLYELKTEFGKTIRLTGCHSIFSLTKRGIDAKRTEELKERDYVAIPLLLPENNVICEINLAQELSKHPDYKRFILRNIPSYIYTTKKSEIYNFLKIHYKKPNQAYYEHKNKNILPLELYPLLNTKELEKSYIGTTSHTGIKPLLKINKDLMRFLGLYTAEGWLNETGNHHRIYFCFNKNELHLIAHVKKVAKELGAEVYVEKPKNNAVKVVINSFVLHRVLRDVLKVSKYALKKRVPEIVFNVEKELQKEYLHGWSEGDYGSTASKDLMNDISYLALFNKDTAAFYSRERKSIINGRSIKSKEYHTNFFARGSKGHENIPVEIFNPLKETNIRLRNNRINRERLTEILDDLRYQRFRNLKLASFKFIREWEKRGFIKEGGISDKGKELLEEINIIRKLINSDLGFAKIISIKKIPPSKDYVYDFSVKDDENFIGGTGGLCCHNSRVNATYTTDVSSRGPTFCFKEGYIQLSDGRVENIKELFEKSKEKFGFKIEDGNEVVEVSNINCCGVDENSLEQKDNKLKTIIKLKAPEKLVKVQFEDGGEVEVTLNHLFHVANESLNLIEAKDLKKGMYVPMPKKLNVSGYRQKIDTYSLIKDFSYSKKICVINSPEIKQIVSREINSLNNRGSRQVLSQKYGVHNSYFYEIISRGNSISFNVLDNICQEQSIDFSSLNDISINVYGGGTKNKTKSIKIPKEVDEDLAYLTGVLISDGHLSKDYIDFSCYNEGVKNAVKEKLLAKFGKFDSYYEDTRVYLCNLFAPFFFNNVFGIPLGKKTHIVKIPQIIFKSDNRVISSFIKGLFDGDGTVSAGLSYKTCSKKLAEGLTYLLARLDIYSYIRKDEKDYRVNIPSPHYKRYLDLIGFCESKKAKALKDLIERQIDYKTFIRHDRIPGAPILSIIKKLGLSKKELIDRCCVSYNRMYQTTFSKSFAAKLLNEIEKHNEKDKVIEEINFVRWMLDSNQEFVRINEVEIIDNKDSVYDITLEPCKFFIAGNKPMNMFDTIRKFTKVPWTPIQLLNLKTLSPEMLSYFWILLEHKSNILISGGTASGKTTLLNAVAFFIPPEARVVSIEDSVTGDSRIIVKENEKIRNITIKEFVKNKIDAEVMTLDENGKILFVKPSSHIKHTVKKDIYEILTSTGRKIKVTEDHSLFSLDENGLIEIKPTELKEGESFIAVPRMLPIKGTEINETNLIDNLGFFKEDFLCGKPVKKIFEKYRRTDFNVKKEKYRWWKKRNIIKIEDFLKINFNFNYEDLKGLKIKSKNKSSIPILFKINKRFLEFCGLWLGDGSYDNYNRNSVILSNSDAECRENFRKIANYLNANHSIMNDRGVSMRIHSSVFYKFMKYVLDFDGYSNTKKIPDFILNLSNEQIKHFIRGYFSADGTMKKNEVSCASQSYTLLEDFQTLFLRLGIISRINDFNRKDKCINLSISSSENIKKFKEISFLQDRKNEKLYSFNKQSSHTHSDIIPLSINELKEINDKHYKLTWPYLQGMQNIGREYLQKIAITGSRYNDLSHNDIYWDKVKKITKISAKDIEVFDLSIPKYEKFMCNNIFVHNTREINLPRENWLPSVARTSLGMGKTGEVDLFSLLKNSFRQNPDYVIVGEVRGSEAFVLFQGMASGHSSVSTMHADSVDTLVKRLETPPINLSPTLLNTLDCVGVMTHAVVNKQQTRRLREIIEIVNVDSKGIALTNTPFVWNAREDAFYFKKDSKVFEKIARRYGLTLDELNSEFDFRTRLLYELQKRKIFDFHQTQKIINEYHKDPTAVLNAFGIQVKERLETTQAEPFEEVPIEQAPIEGEF